MIKSQFGQTSNPHAVVSAQDIGSFVKVQGVGTGALRYVGPIHGKEGLFCGIELDSGEGKHDGSYQGVSYFKCPPGRGIFAPMYKVELDEPEDVPMMTNSMLRKAEERLSRSALPALELKNVFRPAATAAAADPLTASIESLEMNMDASLFSQASWSNVEMCTSNTTYVIPPGKSMLFPEDDEDLTTDIPKSSFQRREPERALCESFVVTNPTMAIENLPVVTTDDESDDLLTPLVEVLPQPPRILSQPPDLPSHAEERAPSPASEDTGFNEDSDASHVSAKEITTTNSTTTPSGNTAKTSTTTSSTNSLKDDGNEMKKVTKEEPKTTSRSKAKQQKEPPPPPKFPVKPKAPSKHQLMMEQLKASIEAEKNKPKKEIKARVPLLPPPPPPKSEKSAEKMEEKPKKQPLKAHNASPKPPPPERPKKERQPLYVPPPPKERKETTPKSSPKVAPDAKKPSRPPSVAKKESSTSVTSTTSKTSFPTSSFAGGKLTKPSATPSAAKAPKGISPQEQLARLSRAVKAFDVLAVVVNRTSALHEETKNDLSTARENLEEHETRLKEVRQRAAKLEQQLNVEREQYQAKEEQLNRSHADAIERLKSAHEQQLAEKAREYQLALEDERSRQQAQADAMSRRHQCVVASLDEKIAETEKQNEQLKADKKSLQNALANDSDQRNQMLTKEINSLQTAYELKSVEMKELRTKYQQVALRVEEIPVKELEIKKLEHKVSELKAALDQKFAYEKLLIHQNEELRRLQQAAEGEKETLRKSIDVMLYQFGGEDSMNTSRSSTASIPPARVVLRASSRTSPRPPSVVGLPPEARLSAMSTSSEMERSVDRESLNRSTISMYTSQCKLPENHAEDVIYAPDEIITSNNTTGCHRMSLAGDELLEEATNGNLLVQQQ